MRAYSIASPNHAEELEFLSIKVPGGPLTSRLQHIEPGQELFVSSKPVGTLVVRDVRPGRTLFLLATGTGLAPFMSIIQDPETYEKFEHVVLAHGVRTSAELAYADFITGELPRDPYLGEEIAAKLLYYPTVTREPFRNTGRLTDLLRSGRLTADLGLPPLDPELDRAMICGSAAMLGDLSTLLDERGFGISPGVGEPGDYVIERPSLKNSRSEARRTISRRSDRSRSSTSPETARHPRLTARRGFRSPRTIANCRSSCWLV